MARGWESKGVEAQQEEAARESRGRHRHVTPEMKEAVQRRRTLELTRARLAADLERATHPAHRETLKRGLDAVDAEIGRLPS